MSEPIPLGFTELDFDNSTSIRIHASTFKDSQDNVRLDMHTWGDTILYSATTNWLDVLALDHNFQFGSFNSSDSTTTSSGTVPERFRKITFPTPYEKPPNVVAWLYELNIASTGGSWRVLTYPSEITNTSFTMNVNTWADTPLIHAAAYWIAMPEGPTVLSGTFTTQMLRPWPEWELKNQRAVTFDRPFKRTPRIVAALSGFDMETSKNLRAQVSITNVSSTGMTWHLDGWGDTVFFDAWGSYVAIMDPEPQSSATRASSSSRTIIIASTIGGVVAIAIVVVAFLFCRRRLRRPKLNSDQRVIDPLLSYDWNGAAPTREKPSTPRSSLHPIHEAQRESFGVNHRPAGLVTGAVDPSPVAPTPMDAVVVVDSHVSEHRLLALQNEVATELAQLRAGRAVGGSRGSSRTSRGEVPPPYDFPRGQSRLRIFFI
jgi:hypothetical protein